MGLCGTQDLHCITWELLLWVEGSVVGHLALVTPGHVGSSQTRDGTWVSSIGKWIFNHWIIRKVPELMSSEGCEGESVQGCLLGFVDSRLLPVSSHWLPLCVCVCVCKSDINYLYTLTLNRESLKVKIGIKKLPIIPSFLDHQLLTYRHTSSLFLCIIGID